MRSLSALSTLGIAASLVVADNVSPPIKVSLTTSWAAPSLLLEIIETATAEHPDHYFEIIDALTNPSSSGLLGPITETVHKPNYVYHTALALLQARGFLTEPSALSSYEKSLALHSAAPKIQAFYQLFGDASQPAECGSWIEWAGKQACGPDEAEELLKSASSGNLVRLFPFDHVRKQPDTECSTPLVFYASLSSQNFYPLYSYLLSKATQPEFCYVMRYSPPEAL
ncbi:UDP-glucose:Glycoprotein Glucosyltransferase [Ceratobasidium sp. AG-Ba]|nr:UDP-glucose:Glycoprotein Glucosyltransferase [Ceratobasidium sp. AG-Ba]